MDYAVAFGRHFAPLVWLLRHDKAAVDDQKGALRVLVTHTKEVSVRLELNDNHIVANGILIPSALPGVSELASRLVAERVASITCNRDAKPGDILGIARLLAGAQARDGESLAEAVQALDPRTVRVTGAEISAETDGKGFTARPGNTAQPEYLIGDALADLEMLEPRAEMLRTQAPQVTERFPEVRSPTPIGMEAIPSTPVELFALLDEGSVPPIRLARILETLVTTITERFLKGDFETAAELLHSLIQREAKAERMAAQGYASALTRILKPLLLQGIASLLPRHRDRELRYRAIFARAKEQGAEAVIAQLGAARSIAERRIYFDALRSNEFSVPSLTQMLGDARWYLVRNAVDLLGLLRAARAEPALLQVLNHDDERVRRSAALALARLGTPTAERAVYRAMNVESSAARHSAATALLTGGGERMALTLVQALERESDEDTQIAILMALGRLATPAAVERLTRAAQPERGVRKRKAVAVRVAATEALAAAGTPAARSALRALRQDKEKDVRGAAFWGLGTGEEGAVQTE